MSGPEAGPYIELKQKQFVTFPDKSRQTYLSNQRPWVFFALQNEAFSLCKFGSGREGGRGGALTGRKKGKSPLYLLFAQKKGKEMFLIFSPASLRRSSYFPVAPSFPLRVICDLRLLPSSSSFLQPTSPPCSTSFQFWRRRKKRKGAYLRYSSPPLSSPFLLIASSSCFKSLGSREREKEEGPSPPPRPSQQAEGIGGPKCASQKARESQVQKQSYLKGFSVTFQQS